MIATTCLCILHNDQVLSRTLNITITVCLCVCLSVCVSVCLCLCVSVCLYVCITDQWAPCCEGPARGCAAPWPQHKRLCLSWDSTTQWWSEDLSLVSRQHECRQQADTHTQTDTDRYTYEQTHRQTDKHKHTDTQIHRQTDTHRHRQIHAQTPRETDTDRQTHPHTHRQIHTHRNYHQPRFSVKTKFNDCISVKLLLFHFHQTERQTEWRVDRPASLLQQGSV